MPFCLALPRASSNPSGCSARRTWGNTCTAAAKASSARMLGLAPVWPTGTEWLWAIYSRERSEEHTSELQSRPHLVCRLLLEKKKNKKIDHNKTNKKNSKE